MKISEILSFLTNDIHSTVFATNDKDGFPHTCVIDIMLCDDSSIYFLTSKGKDFYNRLNNQFFVSISGMKGDDTLSTVAVSVRGKVRELGSSLVKEVFRQNPYMEKIYPTSVSREMLTVFQLYEGEGEFFDLRRQPPFHQSFAFGGRKVAPVGYQILDSCNQCGKCRSVCPSSCIEVGSPFRITEENCIHCGTCYKTCPSDAIKKL